MGRIEIVEGDITTAKVDAIVNAANPAMLGGGGVDGAIHRAAGPELLVACKAVPAVNGERCPTGQARITPAGQLPSQYVIHTVGPVYSSVTNPAELLANAYKNSLDLALEHHCQSIAFPAISCGVYGYPFSEAAAIAVAVCQREKYADLTVYFYLVNAPVISAWQNALGAHGGV